MTPGEKGQMQIWIFDTIENDRKTLIVYEAAFSKESLFENDLYSTIECGGQISVVHLHL